MPYKNKEDRKPANKRYYEKHKIKIKVFQKEYGKNPEVRRKRSNRSSIRAKKTRAWIASIKESYGCLNPNCNCGELKPYHLDCHHINPMAKSFALASSGFRSRKDLIQELNKCTVLCAICHRSVEAGDLLCYDFEKIELNEEGKPKCHTKIKKR